jgi:PHD/YefM family antitoxin component YafN of YafNO toxin-antitoxin module
MKTMKLSKAREQMTALADPIEKTILTKNGEPVSVVMGIQAYRAMDAMLKLATNDPLRFAQTLRAHKQVQAGDLSHTRSLDELEAELKELENSEKDFVNGEIQRF